MNKKIFFVIIFVVLLIGIIGISRALNKPKLDYQLEVVNEINYVVFQENNKFGVINRNGEVVVKPLYDEIQIPNPSKSVFICMYNYDNEKNEYTIKVYNDKDEQILYQFVYVEAIKLNTSISQIPYEKSVLKYRENNKYGLIDFQGKILVKPQYEDIQSFNYNEGLLLVKKDNKYGIININGAVVIDSKYDVIESDAYYEEGSNYSKSGFIIGKKSDENILYGYLDRKGKKVLDLEFSQIDRIENKEKNDNIYLVAFKQNKAGFYSDNKNVIKHEYDDIGYDSNINSLILEKDSKQGISDLNGNILIDLKYDNIYSSGKFVNCQIDSQIDIIDFVTKQKINLNDIVGMNGTMSNEYSIAITDKEKFKIYDCSKNELKNEEYEYLQHIYDNFFIAAKNGKYGIIDDSGKVVVKFSYDVIQKIPNTKIVQAVVKNKNLTEIFTNEKVIASMQNCEIHMKEKYMVLQSENDVKYIDYSGNLINYNDVSDASLHAVKQGEKWGFANKNNDIIIEAKYDYVTEFNEYGFAGIKQAGKWGSINSKGEIIVEPMYNIDSKNPSFIGKYYENDLGYGEPYFIGQ